MKRTQSRTFCLRFQRSIIYAVWVSPSFGPEEAAEISFAGAGLPKASPKRNHSPARPPNSLRIVFELAPDLAPPVNPQNAAMTRIENWTRNHPEWGWRIYRTRAGLRLLATQDLVEADSDVADGVFEALGADPLYRKLCKT